MVGSLSLIWGISKEGTKMALLVPEHELVSASSTFAVVDDQLTYAIHSESDVTNIFMRVLI